MHRLVILFTMFTFIPYPYDACFNRYEIDTKKGAALAATLKKCGDNAINPDPDLKRDISDMKYFISMYKTQTNPSHFV